MCVCVCIIGKRPACLRYPYGASNEAVRDYIRSQGMVPVAMGFNSFDYNRPGTDKIASWVLKIIIHLFRPSYFTMQRWIML